MDTTSTRLIFVIYLFFASSPLVVPLRSVHSPFTNIYLGRRSILGGNVCHDDVLFFSYVVLFFHVAVGDSRPECSMHAESTLAVDISFPYIFITPLSKIIHTFQPLIMIASGLYTQQDYQGWLDSVSLLTPAAAQAHEPATLEFAIFNDGVPCSVMPEHEVIRHISDEAIDEFFPPTAEDVSCMSLPR